MDDRPSPSTSSDRPLTPLDWRFGLGLAALFLVLLVPRVMAHDMWGDEWHTWLVCREMPSLSALFARIRYDGHPATWYVITWLATRVFNDPLAMKLIHAAIAASVVAVVGIAAPFPRWQRALLACGYFFAFEYAVLTRNYSIGALGLLVAAACHARRPDRPIATCAALALAIHSNAFAAIAASVIAAYLALGWLGDRRVPRARLVFGLAILAVSALLVVIEIRPPADINNTPWRFRVDVPLAGQLAAAPWRSFVPLPLPIRAWWGRNILDVPIIRPVQAPLGLIVLWAAYNAVAKDRRLRRLWAAIVIVMLAFAYVKITGSLRHHGTMFIAFVALRWLDRANAPGPVSSTNWRERFWRATLAVQAVAGVSASVADLALPFSAAPAVAAYVRANYPNAQIIAQRDLEGGPIAGELGGTPVYFPVPGRWATSVIYNRDRSVLAAPERLDAVAAELHAADPSRPVLLAISDASPTRTGGGRFWWLATFDDASMSSEGYLLFLWEPGPATRPAEERR